MRSVATVACTCALLSACGTPPPPQAPHPTFDVAGAVARLTLPPDDRTRAALADLGTEARGGDDAARRARALFLLDLFDHARFAAAPASRRLLFEEVGGSRAAPGGELATEWVAERLDTELRRVTAADPAVAAARTLLAVELAGAHADRARLFAGVKRIARDPRSSLRANALLRLYGYCARALRDASTAPRPDRARVANHCLYALFDSDPAAYFAEAPERRPPDPPWTAYRAGLVPLLDEVQRTTSRLAPVAERLAAADRRFFAELAPTALPLPLDVATAGLPAAPGAPLWDHTPLVRLERVGVSLGGLPIVDDARLRSELGALVKQDGRRTLAVVATTNESAQRVLRLAEVARAAGARVLELGVAQPVTLTVPAGDYWAGRMVARLGVLPMALAPLGPAPSAAGRDDLRAARWDPARDELGLTLTVDDTYVLAARNGLVARLATDRAALRAALKRVRRAFPDQSALAVAIGERSTYADLVAAVVAASRDDGGAPLFPALALLPAPPRPHGSIESRIARRAALDVRITVAGGAAAPRAYAHLEAQIRRCYLAAADRRGVTLGHLDFELGARGLAPAKKCGHGVAPARDATLRACVLARLEHARAGLPATAWPPRARVRVDPVHAGR